MIFSRYLFCIVLLVGNPLIQLLPVMAWNEPVGVGSKLEPGPTEGPSATFNVDFRVAITAPDKTRQLRVWLPLPASTGGQIIRNRTLRTFPLERSPEIAVEPTFGNTFAYFEIDAPEGAMEIQHTFTAEIAQRVWAVDYKKVDNIAKWPGQFDVYRTPDARSANAKDYQKIVGQIQSGSLQKPQQLIKAMEWVDEHLTYDAANASLSADPAHALIHRRGHCSDYHGLCGTFAREIGYPARVLYGLQMFDKASPSHCKLEVHIPPYGWVTYDLSETQKLVVKINNDGSLLPSRKKKLSALVRQRTLKGFRENTWLLVTRGENYPLVPAASQPVSIVRTIYAEADGVPLVETDSTGRTRSWMTMQRVNEMGASSRRFSVVTPFGLPE